MRIPKAIENSLALRGWKFVEGETWRKARGLDWACGYFTYKSKCCLITVCKVTGMYLIEILYKIPVCSMYSFNEINKKFEVYTTKI
jgi:hypothetical protein